MSQYSDFSGDFSSLLLIFKKTTPDRRAFEEHVRKVVEAFRIIEQNNDGQLDEEEYDAIHNCIFDQDAQDMLKGDN